LLQQVQEVAIRCVQRNVRRFIKVRDWPWWRLLVRVAPMLNVHRAEEELRKQTEELEGMKVRLEKSEAEKLRLKQQNYRLETRVSSFSYRCVVMLSCFAVVLLNLSRKLISNVVTQFP
jgi:myosin XVIII